jgi:DNA-binding ferritin-like protein
MQIFEKLGLFYLGKKLTPDRTHLSDEYLLYDSKDLSTHAVCVGMTGSGKTGLCISLLEEAAIDNIPSIIIDPKGDMGNLLLSFPDLKSEDFLPWINLDEAKKKNLMPEQFAEGQAKLWKNGLSEWDQSGERITRLRDASDFAIYTPGSNAGLPVSIVDSFSAPKGQFLEDLDLLRERIQTTVSGLLELLGISTDPLQSREHILVSNIMEHCWVTGKDLNLGSLIQMIQAPPIEQVGVFNIEDFYPSSARLKLAMSLNNLLAAPGFKTWMEGETLDIDQMIYTSQGKPRTIIFSISHLSDQERMFFVTLLLNQIIGWMRTQSGSTSLRTILYMDEVFGFLPPVSEPPSKRPILTLLKQARAFGIGVVLSTQNPIDLDYKGLSNAGTWFIGRLQTEKDKERLADGLIRGDQGDIFDKQTLMNTISSLNKREFLMHSVHEKEPQFFRTRWALSYLCGPLTRTQIKTLMSEKKQSREIIPESSQPVIRDDLTYDADIPPALPGMIRQEFASVDFPIESGGKVVYHLNLIATCDVTFLNNQYGIVRTVPVAYTLPIGDNPADISWTRSKPFSFKADIFGSSKIEGAAFMPVERAVLKLAMLDALDKQFEDFVYRNYNMVMFKSETFKIVSLPNESERDFRIRIQQVARERRDLEVERIKRQFSKKIDTLERQLKTARRLVDKEGDQYQQKMLDTAISVGTSIFGAILGGRTSRTSVSRAARSASHLSKEKKDIARAKEKMSEINSRIKGLKEQLNDRINDLTDKFDPMTEDLKKIIIRPKKTDIFQRYFGFFWVPYFHNNNGTVKSLNRLIN